jgi:hypothetical protein
MHLRKKLMAGVIPVGLISALAAVALAVVPAVASATIVTPANEAFTAKLVAGTRSAFLPKNAFEETSVQCEESSASGRTPTEEAGSLNNTNRGPAAPVGEHSTGPGSVLMVFAEAPTFGKCAVYHWNGTAWENTGASATVPTNSTNGKWTFAALEKNTTEGQGSFGVPKKGAEIEIPAFACTEIVAPEEATSVAAPRYVNSTHRLRVDGQIKGEGCPIGSPAQFEAEYELTKAIKIES